MDSLDEIRTDFYEKLDVLLREKRHNSVYLPKEKYLRLLSDVKISKCKKTGKDTQDYWRIKRYDVMKVNHEEKLIFPIAKTGTKVLYYVAIEDLFQVLHDIHVSIGHGGRDKMISEVNKLYKNVTTEAVMVYLSVCVQCRTKSRSFYRKELHNFAADNLINNSKVSFIDIIELDIVLSTGDRYLLIYKAETVILKLLKGKSLQNIAPALLDILSLSNGIVNVSKQERISCMSTVCDLWDSLNGKSSLQKTYHANAEELSQSIRKLLIEWLQKHQDDCISGGLKYVENKLNSQFLYEQNNNIDRIKIELDPAEIM